MSGMMAAFPRGYLARPVPVCSGGRCRWCCRSVRDVESIRIPVWPRWGGHLGVALDHYAAIRSRQVWIRSVDGTGVHRHCTVLRQRRDPSTDLWCFLNPFRRGLRPSVILCGRERLISCDILDGDGPFSGTLILNARAHVVSWCNRHGRNHRFRGGENFPPSVVVYRSVVVILLRTRLNQVTVVESVNPNPCGRVGSLGARLNRRNGPIPCDGVVTASRNGISRPVA